MFIKICGITNAKDALLSLALGADALGFVFASSLRQVSVDQVKSIKSQLPMQAMTFGVFTYERPEKVVEIVHEIGLSGAQLHGNYSVDEVDYVSSRVRKTIRAISAGREPLDKVKLYRCWSILVDAASPGSGEVFDWSLVEAIPERTRMIVAGGLNAGNVGTAIRRLRPFGIDVATGVEAYPGVKDPIALKNFIQEARSAEKWISRFGPDDEVESPVEEEELPYNWEVGF